MKFPVVICIVIFCCSFARADEHSHHMHEMGTGTPPPRPPQSKEQIKRDQEELTNDVRETFDRSMQQNISSAKQTASQLRAHASQASETAKSKMSNLANQIDQQSDRLNAKLNEIRSSSYQNWQKFKSKVEAASRDLQESVKKAKAQLK